MFVRRPSLNPHLSRRGRPICGARSVRIIGKSHSRFIIIETFAPLKFFMDTLIYVLLGLTSVVGLAFIVERALALRWPKVVPPEITASLAACETREDVDALRRVCAQKPSPLGRLLLLAADHFDWPKD